MQINLKDIVLAFRKYCPDHPLKMIADNFFDETGSFKMNLMAEGAWAINSVSAIAQPLQFLAFHSEKAYRDMIINKVSAADKETFNLHNLISAFCELSVMKPLSVVVLTQSHLSMKIELGMILIRMLSFLSRCKILRSMWR